MVRIFQFFNVICCLTVIVIVLFEFLLLPVPVPVAVAACCLLLVSCCIDMHVARTPKFLRTNSCWNHWLNAPDPMIHSDSRIDDQSTAEILTLLAAAT